MFGGGDMDRNSYGTPPQIFAVMNEEFDFKIDVAASAKNKLCPLFITKEQDGLLAPWHKMVSPGDYSWLNPPYDDIGPWVKKAAEQSKLGVGCVMLVMMDQSVGWYAEAIKTCQEVRLITGGRLSFIDPETGKPAGGNNKGSMFLIWHPFGRGKVVVSHVDRDQMMAQGAEIIKHDLLMHIPF